MMKKFQSNEAKKLVGQFIYCVKKDGTVATGKLVKVSGGRLYLSQGKGKVTTSALIPILGAGLLGYGLGAAAPYGGLGYGAWGYPGVGVGYGGLGYGYPGMGFGGPGIGFW